MITSGEVRNQAEIARSLGLTRARVTQIMSLLKLAPAIQKYIDALGRAGELEPQPRSDRQLTERALRPLLQLGSEEEQLRAFVVLTGFDLGVGGSDATT